MAQRFGPDLRTRQGVEKEYIARTRKVGGAGLDMRGKVEAQNMWGGRSDPVLSWDHRLAKENHKGVG